MRRGGGVEQNKGTEENEDDQENKIEAKIYGPYSDNELNRDSGIAEYDDNSDNAK